MPTIDIPDRICPHCGGIRWRVQPEKRPTKADPNKIRIKYICSKKANERTHKWWTNNSDKKEISKRKYQQRKHQQRKKYYYTPIVKESARLRAKKESDTLSDNYVYKMIFWSPTMNGLKRSDIPQKLIDSTRKNLLLKRQLKQLENEKAKQEREKS